MSFLNGLVFDFLCKSPCCERSSDEGIAFFVFGFGNRRGILSIFFSRSRTMKVLPIEKSDSEKENRKKERYSSDIQKDSSAENDSLRTHR